jgi:hypothetical protein
MIQSRWHYRSRSVVHAEDRNLIRSTRETLNARAFIRISANTDVAVAGPNHADTRRAAPANPVSALAPAMNTVA